MKWLVACILVLASVGLVLRIAPPTPTPEPPAPPVVVDPVDPINPLKKLSPESQSLIEAGRVYRTKDGMVGVASMKSGQFSQQLQAWCEEHAKLQADRCRQGHDPLSRLDTFMREMPGFYISEIVAESWPHRGLPAAGPDVWNCWETSPGHWSVANGQCAFWGYALSLGSDGKYYASGLTAVKGPIPRARALGTIRPVERLRSVAPHGAEKETNGR